MKKARARIGSVLVTAAMLASMCAVPALAASYTDIEGHWAEDVILKWSDTGVVKGTDTGTFLPDKNMTRAEAAQIFTNLLKLTEKADISASR